MSRSAKSSGVDGCTYRHERKKENRQNVIPTYKILYVKDGKKASRHAVTLSKNRKPSALSKVYMSRTHLTLEVQLHKPYSFLDTGNTRNIHSTNNII